jgi:hypothetical protein
LLDCSSAPSRRFPYTADEIWSYTPGRTAATVFEAGLPTQCPDHRQIVGALFIDVASRAKRPTPPDLHRPALARLKVLVEPRNHVSACSISEAVGYDAEHPALCDRCAPVVKAITSEARQPALAT